MKCEECLNIITEYVEGELDERTAGFITAHMAGCEACAKVYDKLQREQEMYAGFLSEVQESPALWSAVQASIEKGAAVSATQPLMPTRSWFSGLSGFPRFGLAFALALLIIGMSLGLMRHLTSRRSTPNDLAVSDTPSDGPSSLQSQVRPADPIDPATAQNGVEASHKKTDRTPAKRNAQRDELSKHLLQANSNLRRNNNTKLVPATQLSPALSRPEEWLAFSAETADAMRKRSKLNSLLDGETARHLEQSQVMLRSLRNVIRGDAASTSNISYERRFSQGLLSKNILLRRNAAARGDVLSESLLSRLEPFLLDIANLQDRPSSADLGLIDQRIRENEIIATLQAYIG